MPNLLPVGPYTTISVDAHVTAPWYMLPFDKQGRCEAPQTRQSLLNALAGGDYTDLFVFSHGWNNDWAAASERYTDFINGFHAMRQKYNLAVPRPYRPLLIGILWPSTALVLPWEAAPKFAAGGAANTQERGQAAGQEQQEMQEIAARLPDADVSRFYDLAQRGQGLDADEAADMARMLTPLFQTSQSQNNELPGTAAPVSSEEILKLWRALPPAGGQSGVNAGKEEDDATTGQGGFASDSPIGGLQEAGFWGMLDPRNLIRVATVWQMKDRAGIVGAQGVGPLIQDMLAQSPDARMHLIGHSYGCKVVLSALCAGTLPRKVNSVLLLEAAISYLCFAAQVPGSGQPGGYRPALERVEQPLLTTFSRRDFPLHDFFHLAVRRAADLGEERIAGGAPSRYAALGGYGPGGLSPAEGREIVMKSYPDAYDLVDDRRAVYALDGDAVISGHSDISNEATWWALYNQVVAG